MSLALRAINRLRKQYRSVLNHMRELNALLFNPPCKLLLTHSPSCSTEPLEARLLLSGTHYVVDSLADTIADDGLLTLREAILAANTNEILFEDIPVGSATETDIITFDQAALSAEAGVASGEALTITLSGTQLEIDDDLCIMGLGQDMLSIDADSLSRVMSVRSDVSLAGLTLTGGSTVSNGGGLYNTGTLMLMNSTVFGNSSSRDGGGVYSKGRLVLMDSTVSGNSAGDGGGIYNHWDGLLMITNSTVSDNSSAYKGGGIYVSSGSALTLTGSTVDGNSADSGGGIYNESDAVAVTLTNSTVSGNSASRDGGGIHNLGTMTLTDSTVFDNSAVSSLFSSGDGGGIYNSHSSELTLIRSTVSGNSASGDGGGIYNNYALALTVTDSVVSGNSADSVAGGIYNSSSNATLTNSVVSGNLAACTGGIYHYLSGIFTLTNSTVAGNVVTSPDSIAGYGIYNSNFGAMELNNSIVALNYDSDGISPYGMDIDGDFTANSSLVGMDPGFVRNPSSGIDGLWGTDDDDPGDLRLADTSLAINFGNNALAVDGEGAALTLDFDGNPRIADGTVDIGAYEYQGSPSPSRELSPVVTTLDDVVDSTDGLISLREALVYGGLLGEDVTFDSSLAGGTITLTAGELFIYQSVAVDATSIGGIAIDADSQSRVMYIANCEVALTGLLLTGGLTAESGGGIFSVDSTLVLTNSVVAGNSAYYSGGGIYSDGMLTLTNSTVSGNSATRDRLSYGGGIESRLGTVILNNSIVSLNSAANGPDIFGSFTSNNSLVDIDPGFVRSPSAGIDGIWGTADDDAGDLRLADTSLAIDFGNDALAFDYNGAALTVDIDGNPRIANGRVDIGAYEYQGSPSILRESPSFVVTTLDDVVDFTDGLISLREAMVYGGLLGGDITFDAGLAGGTITLAGRNLYLYQSVSVDATSIGGITIDAGGQSRVMFIGGGEISLTGLRLIGGSVTRGTGGIENRYGSLTLTNSIVSGNVGGYGGGIYSYIGTLTLTNSTVAGNLALDGSGGVETTATVTTLNNSIVALNYGDYMADIFGEFTSNSSLVGIDPGFVRNPSAGDDGEWGTDDDDAGDLRLADTSLAINFGNNALAVDASGSALTFDFEGNPRIADGRVDIGAYEYQAAPSSARELSSIVTTLDDVVDFSDGLISLREAIVYGSLLDEDVTFDASLADGTITLAGEQLDLYQSVTVDATSIGGITIDADGQSRVMYLISGDIYLTALVLTGGEYPSHVGGGIYNSEGCSVTLTNSVVTASTGSFGGAGIYNYYGSVTLISSEVSGNIRGGIENSHGSLTLIDSTISGNNAGSGIENISGSVTLINSEVSGNIGGGIDNYRGNVTLINSIISGNSYGGGVENSYGTVTLTNSTVSGNSAAHGGGISSSGGIVTLANSTITGNTASLGGGIRNDDSTIVLINSIVSGNAASSRGGGIYNTDGTVTLVNSTVSGNTAALGVGGIDNISGIVTLNNSIVALNYAPNIILPYDMDIEGDFTASSSLVGIDPGFVRNPSAGDDGEWGTADDDLGDLRLRPDSVAIGAGDNALAVDSGGDPLATDIRGAERIIGESVDIGAYEYQDMVGDANGDEIVNLDDFIILKQNYGLASGATKAQGDFNTDTGVNLDDFIILKQNYGTELTATPPAPASAALEQSTPATTPALSDAADILAATAVKPILDPIGQLGWISPLEALLADNFEILDIIAAQ